MGKPAAQLKKAKGTKPPFDFDATVAGAYELFPEIARSVFFINVVTGKLVHPDAALRREIIDGINGDETRREMMTKELASRQRAGSSAVMELSSEEDTSYVVYLYLKKGMQSALGPKHSLAENMHLIFDHEMAHAIIEQAHGPTTLPESTADVFAAIRHFQRYGTETGTIEKLMKRRAALGFLNQDGEHFTSPALELLLEAKDAGFDFKALTPSETVTMATYIAQEGTLQPQAMKNLSRHFNKFAKPMTEVKNDAPLRQLAEVAFKSRSPELKKWSTVALKAFLDKDITLKTATKDIELKGRYWNKVRQQLPPG